MMIKPLDLFIRAVALPQIAFTASAAILETRRRIATPLAGRMFDGLFDRVEEQCRSKWADVFSSDRSDVNRIA